MISDFIFWGTFVPGTIGRQCNMKDVDKHVLALICYLLHDRQIKQEVIK